MTTFPALPQAAAALGGEVRSGAILCPGPGHSPTDRSLSVKPDKSDAEGFVVHSFAGDDWKECRDLVRSKLGLAERPEKPSKQNGKAREWTALAEYVYRDVRGAPYLKIRKCLDEKGDKQYPQSHWDGKAWVKGKPSGSKIPYRLPELLAAPLTTIVYFCEGEKDADSLAKLGFVASTASEGASAKWDSALTPYFKDRNVVILPDADTPGRKHAQKVAKALNGVVAFLRVLDLYPDLADGSDVSDWLVEDTTGAKLAQRASETPSWEPPADDADQASAATDSTDAEIARLAKLSLIQYDNERKSAAENLGVRAATLDLIVQAEREKLGLDGGDEGKQGRAISFPEPEPWPDPVDGARLLDDLAKAIRNHVVMSDSARDAAALWVAHAYMIDCFLVSPRLGVTSPVKGCGKTTLLDVMARLVPRALPTANVTPPALFRVVEGYRPTLLVDEADSFLHDNDELRGVLNSGHRKGGTVLRTVGDDHEPRAFNTFCPTVIALIGHLPDTLHDRAVAIDLKRRLRTESVEPFRPDRAGHLDVLARKAIRWTKDHADAIAERDPTMPENIINRMADNWRPLLAIADVAGEGWPERARKAAEAARLAAADDDASRLELLLGDIRDAFGERVEMSSADLVEALIKIEGRPWADGLGKNRDKPLTQNRLARMLKPLKITSEKVGPEDKRVAGYVRKHFDEPFARYLESDEGVSKPDIRTECDEMGTSDIFKADSPAPGCPVAKCEKSNNDGLLSGCPVVKRGAGANGSDEPGLSVYRIRSLADEYTERAYANAQENEGDTRTAELDAWLRRALAEEVLPEHVETEFRQVMDMVFRI